ncbi:hypothetical protein [Novosphingobium meiothermophilum]|uniref:hypothetical protein n=1 Tax=Novosphingobium meiothermophilum TaxID=2202251 RepID=UPI000D6DCD7A|nr:hypothetical protein [Novosphingobium meiothermophilum]
MDKSTIADALARSAEFLSGIAPGALGAAVASLYKKGATWGERFVQLAVGIVVSYFAKQILGEVFPTAGDFTRQGVSFVAGLVAYEAIPGFIHSFATTAKKVPGDVWENLKLWFRRPE